MRPYWRAGRVPNPRRSLYRIVTDAIFALLLAAIILYATNAFSPFEEPANVTVVDGDTLKEGRQGIRLHGIDAPELDQYCGDGRGVPYACGEEAKRSLAHLIAGQTVQCRMVDSDRYRREVSICRSGETNLNREMVRLGWAVAYRKHSLDYVGAENEARRNRRGLWAGTFEAPEKHRGPRQLESGLPAMEDE